MNWGPVGIPGVICTEYQYRYDFNLKKETFFLDSCIKLKEDTSSLGDFLIHLKGERPIHGSLFDVFKVLNY